MNDSEINKRFDRNGGPDRDKRLSLAKTLRARRELWVEARRQIGFWLTGSITSEKVSQYETFIEELDLQGERIADGLLNSPKNHVERLRDEHEKMVDALAVSKHVQPEQLTTTQLVTLVRLIVDYEKKFNEPKRIEDLKALRDRCGLNEDDIDFELLKELQLERLLGACVDLAAETRGITVADPPPPPGMKAGGGWDTLYHNDKLVMQTAVGLWEKTFKLGMDDADALAEIRTYLHVRPLDEVKLGKNGIDKLHGTGLFLAKWAHHAFPRIVTTHTYAAALMGTTVTRDILEDLEVQWKAFEVVIPNGLLIVDGLDYSRIRIRITDHEDPSLTGWSEMWLYTMDTKAGMGLSVHTLAERSLADLLATGLQGKEPLERAAFLARRLVSGLLLAMQYPNNFSDKKQKKRTQVAREFKREDPKHRVVMVGSPVKVDARPMVARFLRVQTGRRTNYAPPSVQSWVRGHYKRQVIGIGRNGRKVIHVEGYWRGDENAPILTRPQKVSG